MLGKVPANVSLLVFQRANCMEIGWVNWVLWLEEALKVWNVAYTCWGLWIVFGDMLTFCVSILARKLACIVWNCDALVHSAGELVGWSSITMLIFIPNENLAESHWPILYDQSNLNMEVFQDYRWWWDPNGQIWILLSKKWQHSGIVKGACILANTSPCSWITLGSMEIP